MYLIGLGYVISVDNNNWIQPYKGTINVTQKLPSHLSIFSNMDSFTRPRDTLILS